MHPFQTNHDDRRKRFKPHQNKYKNQNRIFFTVEDFKVFSRFVYNTAAKNKIDNKLLNDVLNIFEEIIGNLERLGDNNTGSLKQMRGDDWGNR